MATGAWDRSPTVMRGAWDSQTPPPDVSQFQRFNAWLKQAPPQFQKYQKMPFWEAMRQISVDALRETAVRGAGMAAAAVSPGGAIAGPLTRLATVPGAEALTRLVTTGGDVEAAKQQAGQAVLGQALGETAGGVGRGIAAGRRVAVAEKANVQYAEKQAHDIAEGVKNAVPTLKSFPSTAEGLWNMLYSPQGRTALKSHLDKTQLTNPDAYNLAYRTVAGLRGFFQRSGALPTGGPLQSEAARQALTRQGEQLTRRPGLERPFETLQQPAPFQAAEATPAQRRAGQAAGFAAGLMGGRPIAGSEIGKALAAGQAQVPIKAFPEQVPAGPLAGAPWRATLQTGQQMTPTVMSDVLRDLLVQR